MTQTLGPCSRKFSLSCLNGDTNQYLGLYRLPRSKWPYYPKYCIALWPYQCPSHRYSLENSRQILHFTWYYKHCIASSILYASRNEGDLAFSNLLCYNYAAQLRAIAYRDTLPAYYRWTQIDKIVASPPHPPEQFIVEHQCWCPFHFPTTYYELAAYYMETIKS